MNRRRRIPAKALPSVFVAAAAAALLAAVALASGGGSSAGSPSGSERSVAVEAAKVAKSSDSITDTNGATVIDRAAYPNGRDTDEVSASGAKPIKACRLVTKSQAKRILGSGLRMSENPQGPTCIYAASGREITLVIEKISLSKLRAGARHARRLRIAGRTGWCLRYESTSVVVGLGRGAVLQVTGPCQAGVRFAAHALHRIAS